MSLGTLALALWGLAVGLTWAGVTHFGSEFLGWFAVIWAVLLLLEGAGVWSYSFNRQR